MKFEYKVKIFSMKDLKEKGIVVDSENNIVYACRTDGACEIHDVKMEQLDNLSSVLNVMGEEGMGAYPACFSSVRHCQFLEEVYKKKEITILTYQGRYSYAAYSMEIFMGDKISFVQRGNG